MNLGRVVEVSDILRCPRQSLSPAHYRGDGNCECRRELFMVAAEITAKWKRRPAAVEPVLNAMGAMRLMSDTYPDPGERPGGPRFAQVDGNGTVRSFLVLATDWHGAHARRLKAELRALLPKEE